MARTTPYPSSWWDSKDFWRTTSFFLFLCLVSSQLKQRLDCQFQSSLLLLNSNADDIATTAAQENTNSTTTKRNSTSSTTTVGVSDASVKHQISEASQNLLIGPVSTGSSYDECPTKDCGCPNQPQDCPQYYTAQDVITSSYYNYSSGSGASTTDPTAEQAYWKDILEARKQNAMETCHQKNRIRASRPMSSNTPQETGGWCLVESRLGQTSSSKAAVTFPDGTKIPMAKHHVGASKWVVKILLQMIKNENIRSITDLGAGIGQYKAALSRHTQLEYYHAYDGAGNIEDYTFGQVLFADLTLPLTLPISDWVLSLEVGEHIPYQYEGRFIRNLHRHNKKGIILSWGVLGQGGYSHINNHSNEYIIGVFNQLGYDLDKELTETFRNDEYNHDWFQKSIMVFRRRRVLVQVEEETSSSELASYVSSKQGIE